MLMTGFVCLAFLVTFSQACVDDVDPKTSELISTPDELEEPKTAKLFHNVVGKIINLMKPNSMKVTNMGQRKMYQRRMPYYPTYTKPMAPMMPTMTKMAPMMPETKTTAPMMPTMTKMAPMRPATKTMSPMMPTMMTYSPMMPNMKPMATMMPTMKMSPTTTTSMPMLPTVAEILSGDDRFSTLVAALTIAFPNLAETMQSVAPFTLFAPTNDVFATVPEDALAALLADPETLQTVLLRHAVPKMKVTLPMITSEVDSAEGGQLKLERTISSDEGSATITEFNIMASDGVIHVINNII